MTALDRRLYVFVSVVAVGGAMVLVASLSGGGHLFPANSPAFWVLAAGVLLGELRPVRIIPRLELTETTSTTFAFALLLGAGPGPAAAAFVLGSIVSDFLNRKSLLKVVFNAGQYALTVAAAGVAIRLLSDRAVLVQHGKVGAGDLLTVVVAMVTWFLVNNVLIGIVNALALHAPMLPLLRRELELQAAADGVLLALSPVVLVVAQGSLALVPFLLVPIIAVYIATRVSLDRQHEALHDALTGLPNRMLFRDHLQEALAQAGEDAPVAVLLLDLDGFKDVNDTIGHHIGDLLLKEVGPRLAATVSESHVVARLGGDEFAVMIPEVFDAKGAVGIANRLVAALTDPFDVQELKLHVDASVGIALYPQDADDADTLLQRADVAMYVAKDERSRVELYSSERDVHSRRRLTLLGELRGAITDGQLTLHYQPLVELETRRIVGVEALVRWDHPTLGHLPPFEFIPLAERSGLIGPLSEFVLEAAIKQNAAWQAEGIVLRTAVNLSVRNLADLGLPLLVAKLLDRAGIAADCLDLEITESTIMADPARAMTVLEPLSQMGIRLAIDDFGTGYSSLAYLRQLPLSVLKIDKSFVGQMTESENDAIIVRSTIDLAHNLGLEVIAEGVEDEISAERLYALGCPLAQGYHFARPAPPEQITPVLRAGLVARP
ncbi:MAG: EAL domain-containing protein [Actinobacteria bacterium]|nr:EAL domain-containing protein [Actinomycetota bacterium]